MKDCMNRETRRKLRMKLQLFASNKMKGLVEQRADLVDEMNNLLEAAKVENRAMSEEEETKFNDIEKQINSIDATIDAENRAESIRKAKNVFTNDALNETIEEIEERAFDSFLRGVVEERADASLTQGANGSVVPKTIANRIIQAVKDRVDFLKYADVVYINGTLSIPVYTDVNEAQYIDEDSGSETKSGAFTTIDLTGYVIEAISAVSKKMITNVDFDLVGFVVEQIVRKLVEKLEKEFINGTAGKITGVLSTTNTIAAASATAVTYDELVKTKHKLKQAFQKNGVWLMHPDTYTALCLLKDANNQPYFKDDDYKILNRPVLVSDGMPQLATGQKAIIFGDLSGYTIKIAKTIEVNILNELFARKNAIGVQGLVEVDAKISDSQKIVALLMA